MTAPRRRWLLAAAAAAAEHPGVLEMELGCMGHGPSPAQQLRQPGPATSLNNVLRLLCGLPAGNEVYLLLAPKQASRRSTHHELHPAVTGI